MDLLDHGRYACCPCWACVTSVANAATGRPRRPSCYDSCRNLALNNNAASIPVTEQVANAYAPRNTAATIPKPVKFANTPRKLSVGRLAADASETIYLAQNADLPPVQTLAEFETERHPEFAGAWAPLLSGAVQKGEVRRKR